MRLGKRVGGHDYTIETLWDKFDVARRLAVSVNRIESLVKGDEIPFVRIGKEVRFDLDTINRWIKAMAMGKKVSKYNGFYEPIRWESRTRKVLARLGIETMYELSQRTEKEIMLEKGVGSSIVMEMEKHLAWCGLSFKTAKGE